MSAFRTHTVTDADGYEWEVSVEVGVRNPEDLIATIGELRAALPGPVRERLIDDLRDDVERML